ncbi:MAG: class I SAM-dependent methyltransferase [Clostridia bacterium]|nr:class I SAM-dependent methyltransferase [Clostridia bacterium]
MERKYYEAYDERYKTAHENSVRWLGDAPSPIVNEIISRYGITKESSILELGCGEGRDAVALLEKGYNLTATDISQEAIRYCGDISPNHKDRFSVLDCVRGELDIKFDFIYAVAVIHMLVDDADREAFYRFIREHLTDNGLALICTMGDGETERKSDVSKAFELQEREEQGKKLLVAGTSCRMVSKVNFEKELTSAGFKIVECGTTEIPVIFPVMMYAVVKK